MSLAMTVSEHAMPLLDHFHPPLHGPRRWEGFHHAFYTATCPSLRISA
jgi:hypothetical protein